MLGMNSKNGTGIKTLHDHIKQSIADIINTPVGSRLMRPKYGSLVPAMIDQPMNNATTLRLYSSIATALLVWEKRITLNAIALYVDASGRAQIELDIKINDQQETLVIPASNTGASL
jgi:phage baseplate assembly protein W